MAPGAGSTHHRATVRRLAGATGALALALALPLSTPGAAGAAAKKHASTPVTVKKVNRGKLGAILVTAQGFTLYHFTQDKKNTPTCTGACNSLWPALVVAAGTTPKGASGVSGLGTVKLADGTRQVTYHGQPLYRFAPDTSTTDAKGQGVAGLWFVVHPAVTASVPRTTTTTRSGGYGY
jgi:predicted lipoprotein with Yx(FWY)xxD motif